MGKYIIQGGQKLKGSINVSGNKNSVLPIIASTLLMHGETVLTNVPRIKDVMRLSEILVGLGATVEGVGSSKLTINTEKVTEFVVDQELSSKLRASVLLIGPLFSRFGKVEIYHPGGDIIGKRNIDAHLSGLKAIGAKVKKDDMRYSIKKEQSGNKSVDIFLDEPSVTGTENLIMVSVLGDKTVVLNNSAAEPHIIDLASFLNACGANINGAGTNKITIQPVKELKAHKHTICPDYIEVGTFAALSASTKSNITVCSANPYDLQLPINILRNMGVNIDIKGNSITVKGEEVTVSPKRIQAMPHPGFPTDLMSPFIVLGTQAHGETLFHDPMYESRMFFVDKLISMGARITICDPHRVIVSGPSELYGRKLDSPDIRAGIALVIAALTARGESIIDNTEIIERGYENLVERLQALGARIRRYE